MPNWSYNNLEVSGDPEQMKEFYSVLVKENLNKEMSFRFSNIFPMPEKIKNTISPSSSAKGKKWINEEVAKVRDNRIGQLLDHEPEIKLIPCENNSPEKCSELIEEFGCDNWYDWNINEYGTKWDIESLEFHKDDRSFQTSFETAWSPPAIFLKRLQDKFPKLDIRLSYELEGSMDCGLFYTNRYINSYGNSELELVHELDECYYESDDGESIYYDNKDGEYHYEDNNEICYDYNLVNPLNPQG